MPSHCAHTLTGLAECELGPVACPTSLCVPGACPAQRGKLLAYIGIQERCSTVHAYLPAPISTHSTTPLFDKAIFHQVLPMGQTEGQMTIF